jgi:hypothetical protein
MPPFLRKRLILIAVAPGCIALVMQVALTALLPRWPSARWIGMALAAVYLLSMIPLVARVRRWRRGIEARLAAADGRVCFRCGYDLAALGTDTGVCPECGEAFVAGALRVRWKGAGFFRSAVRTGDRGPPA